VNIPEDIVRSTPALAERNDRALAAQLGVQLTTAWLNYAGRVDRPLPPNNICWQEHADQILAYITKPVALSADPPAGQLMR